MTQRSRVGILLALCALFTMLCLPAAAFADSTDAVPAENSWRYRDGELIQQDDGISLQAVENAWTQGPDGYINSLGGIIPGAVRKGIDVSKWNGDIDWETVKNSDVDFAIIRCGFAGNYTKYDDPYWEENADECTRLGIPFGAYLYSYATTVSGARSEAEHALRLLEGYDLDYPIYLDLEDSSTLDADHTEIAKTFCSILESHGYEVGVYANMNWWNTYLTDPVFDSWDRWVARYNYECAYDGPYSMWQCTSTGKVAGIGGNVDLNFEIEPTKAPASQFSITFKSNGGTAVASQTEQRGAKIAKPASPTRTDYRFVGWYSDPNLRNEFDFTPGIYDDITLYAKWERSAYRGFTDVKPSDWYVKDGSLDYVLDHDIMHGYDWSTKFGPNDSVSRAQVITVLWNLAGNPTVSHVDNFSDCTDPDAYYYDAVRWARSVGIGNGYGDENRFGPNDAVKRQDLAQFLANYASIVAKLDVSSNMVAASTISGWSSVSSYAREAVGWAVDKGITRGGDTNQGPQLQPHATAWRSSLAAMVAHFHRDVLK